MKRVKIGVVLTDPEDWTARAFLRSVRRRGAEALPFNLSQLSTSLSSSVSASDFSVSKSSKDSKLNELNELEELDAVLVRDVGASPALEQISFKFDLLRLFEDSGVPVVNSPAAIQNAANKFFSLHLLKQAGLPFPRTVVTSELEVAERAVAEFGTAVVKPVFGSQGRGVLKLESLEQNLKSKLAGVLKERGVLYLQEFVPNPGRDIRVFVVGGEVVGAIYRIPQSQSQSHSSSFVSNLSQGGRAVKCEPTAEVRELAVRAAKAVGADFAGVDLLEGKGKGEGAGEGKVEGAGDEGVRLLEVNATPSGRGIKIACGVDVSEKVVGLLF
ncbi:MAG: tetrahydromethanopterin:alpha-L-glutamate ligase [Candidatus Methanophagaceae archaeon]|nr:MAG: tetrahydromethanopterin:alpha-L-glutamate ligase [Methanophagales archaeon]